MVGAYAALPGDRSDQAEFYAGLGARGLATALEIPDTHVLGVPDIDMMWLAGQLSGRFTGSAVTAIPGTMKRQARTPGFGLASPHESLRQSAVNFVRDLRGAAEELNQITGEQSVSVLEIHSAPGGNGTVEAFSRSLEDLSIGHWTTRLVIEHCDARNPRFPGEKGFLQAHDEMRLAREYDVGFAVNWGRSALEGHDPSFPQAHIRHAVAQGVLEGVIFSGAGDSASAYGAPWADAHLPLREDEPTSLMDAAAVASCVREAGIQIHYHGIKVQVPANASLASRLGIIGSVAEAIRAS
ncbi:DUF4862 family protein [Sinomonas soli]